MTAIDRLRHRLGSPGTVPRAFFDLETVRALLQLADAFDMEGLPTVEAYLQIHLPGYAPLVERVLAVRLKLENLP